MEEEEWNRPYSEKHQKRIRKAKKAHRPDLKDWSKQQHSKTWWELKDELIHRARCPPKRIRESDLTTVEDFRNQFERPRRPCILLGCAENWPAREKWNVECLRERFGKVKMKCGEDDDGYPVKVRLETFMRYQKYEAPLDDSPLYVFDSCFDKTCEQLLFDYNVPSVFPEDLFVMVGDKRRPPHRWFLLGPERSGSTIHIDPLETSAWNTSVKGRKLWIMFSPEVPKHIVKGKRHMKPKGDDEAVDYFGHILPHVIRDLPKTTEMFYFIQHPGETVFVPYGWWHAVLNLDDTIAITHNYVSTVNFPAVWTMTREERRKMSVKWKLKLGEERPDLFAVAENIDATVPLRKKQKHKVEKVHSSDVFEEVEGHKHTA